MKGELPESRGRAGAEEIERLAREFESLTVSKFGHAEHLTVALWYLTRLPEAEARERVRAGLRRLSEHDRDGRYNETLTLFWLKAAGGFLRRAGSDVPLAVLRGRLLARFASSRLVFDYYSAGLLHSDEAKTSWVEPDLKPIDF